MAAYTITTQPGIEKGQMVPMQQQQVFAAQSAPPGLEYLSSLSTVRIHQVLHLIEVLVGWERNNVYNICNEQDQQFLTAKEETDCCTRQMLGPLRPFDIHLSNMHGQNVIDLNRGCRCQGCCCPCCLQQMDIYYPPGRKIATIKELWTCWTPKYVVEDVNEQVLYRVEGPCMWCMCCTDIPFKFFRADGQECGGVTKHWGGFREVCGGANDFSVTFDPNENVLNKAIMLGAAFLIDYMYFEKNNNN